MKKILLSFLAVFGFTLFMSGQTSNKHALGIRLSPSIVWDGLGMYTEASYQLAISKINRIELGFGYAGHENRYFAKTDVYKFVGMCQWVKRINDGFGWYLGGGAGLGRYSTKIDNGYSKSYNISGMNFAVAGQVGVQYEFIGFPFLVSVDLRPEYNTNSEWRKNYSTTWLAFSGRFTF